MNRRVMNYEGANTKTKISTSTVSGDQTFESVKSEITDLHIGNVNFEVNTITHDSNQHNSESSCSNYLSVNLPVQLSSLNFLEFSKEAYSRCISSADEQLHTGPVGKSSICSDISDSFNCTSKTVDNIRLCNEHDNLLTPLSEERKVINHEIFGEGENISGVKGRYESSESSIAKVAEFDLNEDFNANEVDDFIQPVVGGVSSDTVIRVVAKTGVLSGRPVIPLEFEGGLAFTGPSETSAFRTVAIFKNSDRNTRSTKHGQKDTRCCFNVIDLNVAATEESAVSGIIHMGPILQDSRPKVDLKRAGSHCIDLNRLYDAGDDFTRFSVPVKLESNPLLDSNLNVNANNKTSYHMKSGYQDFHPFSHDSQPDLSTMQHFADYSPSQPKSPFLSPTLPPQSYPSFKILPGLLNPGTVNVSFGNNHFEQVFREHSTSNFKTEDKFLQEGDWFETSKKRKETEGGLDCYQVGYEKGIWKQR